MITATILGQTKVGHLTVGAPTAALSADVYGRTGCKGESSNSASNARAINSSIARGAVMFANTALTGAEGVRVEGTIMQQED